MTELYTLDYTLSSTKDNVFGKLAGVNRRAAKAPKAPRIGDDGLSFGARLRSLREHLKLSYADVAAASGMSAQSIAYYEANPAAEPEYFNGLAIAKALKVSPWELAGLPEPMHESISLMLDERDESMVTLAEFTQQRMALENLKVLVDRIAKQLPPLDEK